MGSGGLELSLQQKQSISEVWKNLYNKNKAFKDIICTNSKNIRKTFENK